MRIDLIVTAIVSALAGGLIHYIFSSHIWPNRHRTYSWWFTLRNHRRYGEPCSTDLVLEREGYALGFSFKFKSALWVSYILNKNSIGVDVERGEDYFADPEVPEKYRVEPDDYANTGFDKGHLAPSASIDFSRRSNDETFAMSNVVLQDPVLNRRAWGKLERLVRKWTFTKGKLAVVTGPVYGKRNKRAKGYAIPRYLYKVVYCFRYQQGIAFLLPNEPVQNDELWEHALSIKDLEKELGYKFFQTFGSKSKERKKKFDLAFWRDDKAWNANSRRNK